MTDQERKQRILIKLRNILFLLLGITVLFISIESIIQNPKNFISNLIPPISPKKLLSPLKAIAIFYYFVVIQSVYKI